MPHPDPVGLSLGLLAVAAPAGAYLSWVKLLLVALVYVVWVRMADWINRDAMKIGDRSKLHPEVWNPITTGSFLLGLLCVLFIPIFSAGFSVYAIAAIVPWLTYFFIRWFRIKASPEIAHALSGKPGEAPPPPPLPQDAGADIDFTPAGSDKKQRQVNLIRARQSSGFPLLKDTLADALFKRADVVLLDYTRDQVAGRLQVDGVWHPLPAIDRASGDPLLVSLKYLAGLDPANRRTKQTGQFQLKTEFEKPAVEVLTQGTPNGERAQIRFLRKKKSVMNLGQLGMFPDMIKRLKTSLNQKGLAIITAPAGDGMTSSWRGTLVTADRMTRDCVAILDEQETDTAVENIAMRRYDGTPDKTASDVTRATLLTQPHLIVFPDHDDAEILDLLTEQVKTRERSLLLKTTARSAAEGLVAVSAKAGNREQFVDAVQHVTGQRLVRRLCDDCKQEVRVPPKTIQQLGGDPKKQSRLFNQYRLPPPEQRVDEKGEPIEFPPCSTCGGIGYIGRIGVFELIEIDDSIRSLLRQNASSAAIESAAKKGGKRSLTQQAYQFVLLGITSLAEIQRVFKK